MKITSIIGKLIDIIFLVKFKIEVKPQANNVKQQQIQLQQQAQPPYFNVQNNWAVQTPQIPVPINSQYNMIPNMQQNWQGQVQPATTPIRKLNRTKK
jgi:hypothetical protein